jgi:5-formyltetrahydrofolate cyclo-ligase
MARCHSQDEENLTGLLYVLCLASRTKSYSSKGVRERIKNLSEEERVKQSQVICQHILKSSQWKQAKCLLLYSPLKDEPDITSLFATALLEEKLLYLPQYNSNANEYSIAPVKDIEKDIRIGKYNIKEPITCATRQKDIDFILVLVYASTRRAPVLAGARGFMIASCLKYPVLNVVFAGR